MFFPSMDPSWEYTWGFPSMVDPKNGWVLLRKIPFRNGWWLGVPLFQETSIWIGQGLINHLSILYPHDQEKGEAFVQQLGADACSFQGFLGNTVMGKPIVPLRNVGDSPKNGWFILDVPFKPVIEWMVYGLYMAWFIKWMIFVVENPKMKWMIDGVPPVQETSICCP